MTGFPSGVPGYFSSISYLDDIFDGLLRDSNSGRPWDAQAQQNSINRLVALQHERAGEYLRGLMGRPPTPEELVRRRLQDEQLERAREELAIAEEARRQRRRFAWSLGALWLTLTVLWIYGLRIAGFFDFLFF